MKGQTPTAEDDDLPPSYDDAEEYKATKMLRTGRMSPELWFVTADGKGECIFPIADKRLMEPPDDPSNEIAYIHFSGIRVALYGYNLRQVLKDICTHRCTEIRQIRPGQKRPTDGAAIIDRIVFGDLSKPRRKEGGGGARAAAP
jgi:hypothetical protein